MIYDPYIDQWIINGIDISIYNCAHLSPSLVRSFLKYKVCGLRIISSAADIEEPEENMELSGMSEISPICT